MRILVISAAYPPFKAGESEHCLKICTQLSHLGFEVDLITGYQNTGKENAPFNVHPVMRGWRWRDLPRLLSTVRSLRPSAILLIYCSWIYDDHTMITILPALLKRGAGVIRLVTMMELYSFPEMGTPSRRILRKLMSWVVKPGQLDYWFGSLLRDSDALIMLSEKMLDQFILHLPSARTKSIVIPPPPLIDLRIGSGADIKAGIREKLNIREDEFVLAFFGYVYEDKGVDTLLRAVDILARRACRVRLIMVGGARGEGLASKVQLTADAAHCFESGMVELAEHLGIADKVDWLPGYTSESNDPSVSLSAADIAVLPFVKGVELRRSSLAIVAAHGLPVLTTWPEQLESAFRDQENVLLCKPCDPVELSEKILQLMSCSDLRHTLSQGAITLANDWFSWPNAMQGIVGTLTGKSSRLDTVL